ncbi:hypothetical protein DPM19_24890 [Actinomadura craniellae]|uniref:Uncharacterized protein n=1 Tax=Actinomadura craniellae TaxID=2231787 RepID=A0A365GZX0_9ACTN|nr:hypothetical protein [Actinomadura craniellae]RAY12389.1 hypothetical protein DPM19_24890 [Actinomadura craniellae]
MPAETTTGDQDTDALETAEPETTEPEDAKATGPEADKPENAKADEPEKPEADEPEAAKADEPEEPRAGGAKKPKTPKKTKTPNAKAKKAKADEPEKAEREEHDSSRRRVLSGATLLKAALPVALVASVVTAGLQWYQADQAAQREADRQAVRARAGEFGRALLSYDHRNLQAARNRVLSLASDDFAKTYDAAFTGGLEGVIARLKADATATVRTVYLGDIEGSTARAIVVMDSEVRSSAGTRRVLGSHLDMRLIRTGERWRITEVTSIGAANETMVDGDGKQRQGGGAPLPNPSPSSGG